MPPPRRFAYYDRLSREEQATYRKSDEIGALKIPDRAALLPLVSAIEIALFSSKRVRVAKAVTAFIDALLAQVGAPPLKVHVREVRPDLEGAELHGLYSFATETSPPRLEVWMRTRAHERVVKHRTFMRTIFHEILHHLDVTTFALDDSFHTAGFFRRESSMARQLLERTERARVASATPNHGARPASTTRQRRPPNRQTTPEQGCLFEDLRPPPDRESNF